MESSEPCLFCGEPEVIEVHEVWGDHNVMFETCCLGLHEALNQALACDAQDSRGRGGSRWIRDKIEQAVGYRARRMLEIEGSLRIDFAIEFEEVTFREACAFIDRYHEHCDAPTGWKFGRRMLNGMTPIGVITVGRPVSRLIDARGDTLEVNRLCLDRSIPDGLRWNACSQAYAMAAKETERRGYGRIMTYIRSDEPGTSLRACGWMPVATTKAADWSRKRRLREPGNPCDRIRWEKALRPTRTAREALLLWQESKRQERERRRAKKASMTRIPQAA